jgi:hypothetical protein
VVLHEGIVHEELACGDAFRKRTELGELIPALLRRIKLTENLHGRWLPMANKAAVDRRDDPLQPKW